MWQQWNWFWDMLRQYWQTSITEKHHWCRHYVKSWFSSHLHYWHYLLCILCTSSQGCKKHGTCHAPNSWTPPVQHKASPADRPASNHWTNLNTDRQTGKWCSVLPVIYRICICNLCVLYVRCWRWGFHFCSALSKTSSSTFPAAKTLWCVSLSIYAVHLLSH